MKSIRILLRKTTNVNVVCINVLNFWPLAVLSFVSPSLADSDGAVLIAEMEKKLTRKFWTYSTYSIFILTNHYIETKLEKNC